VSDTPKAKQINRADPTQRSVNTVQWWDGVEWRSHHEYDTPEEAIGASRAQNRKREQEEDGHDLYPVEITEVLG
jgi:hypothetical protein